MFQGSFAVENMKKYFLAGLVIVGSFFSTYTLGFAQGKMPRTCVSFSMQEVPDETKPEWKFLKRWDASKDRFALIYKTQSGFSLGVWHYFGQLAFKAWACRASEGKRENPKDAEDHMISIFLEDGTWSQPVYAQRPRHVGVFHLGEVILYLEDKDGNIVARRTFRRPK